MDRNKQNLDQLNFIQILTWEERYEWINQKKLKANRLFKSEKIQDALKIYLQSLIAIKNDKDQEQNKKRMQEELQLPIISNIVNCYLKLKQNDKALESSNELIQIAPNNSKYLTRRGQSNFKLKRFRTAKKDFVKAYKNCQNQDEKKNVKEIYRGLMKEEKSYEYIKLQDNSDLSNENMSDEDLQEKKQNSSRNNFDEEYKEKIQKLPVITCSFCSEDIQIFCNQCEKQIEFRIITSKTPCFKCFEFLKIKEYDKYQINHKQCNQTPQKYYKCDKCGLDLCEPHNEEALINYCEEKRRIYPDKLSNKDLENICSYLELANDAIKEDDLYQMQRFIVFQLQLLILQNFYQVASQIFKQKQKILNKIQQQYCKYLLKFYENLKQYQETINNEQSESKERTVIFENLQSYEEEFNNYLKENLNDEFAKYIKQILINIKNKLENQIQNTEDQQKYKSFTQFRSQKEAYKNLDKIYQNNPDQCMKVVLDGLNQYKQMIKNEGVDADLFQFFLQLVYRNRNQEIYQQFIIDFKNTIIDSQQMKLIDSMFKNNQNVKIMIQEIFENQ